MKITQGHLNHLRTEIAAVLDKYPDIVSEYEQGKFPRADKVKDLQKRFCFDLMYGAGLQDFVCKEIYPYANDTHLLTALKQVCPAVVRKY